MNDAIPITLEVGDLFSGAGGFTLGSEVAMQRMNVKAHYVVVNHDPEAVANHELNHPKADHYCIDLDAARPEILVPSRKLDLLVASPSCTHHSRAAGGATRQDQRRADPFHIQRWAAAIDIRVIVIENVEEILSWDAQNITGKTSGEPGAYYKAWELSLRAMGYDIEWKILNAADYGVPQSRRRWICVCRKDGVKIVWPEPTHAPREIAAALGKLPYVGANTCINREHPTLSVFDRPIYGRTATQRKPLARATMRRVAVGCARFGGPLWPYQLAALATEGMIDADDAQMIADRELRRIEKQLKTAGSAPLPFIFGNRANNVARDTSQPAPTILTATGGGAVVSEIEMATFTLGQHGGAVVRPGADPIATVATDGANRTGDIELAAFTLGQHGNAVVRAEADPVATVATAGRIRAGGIELRAHAAEPCLLDINHAGDDESRVTAASEPMRNVTTRRGFAVSETFITSFYGDKGEGGTRAPRSGDDPSQTVTTNNRFGLCSTHLAVLHGTSSVKDLQNPSPAILAGGNHLALVDGEMIEAHDAAPRASTVSIPTQGTFFYPRHGERVGQEPRTHDGTKPMPTITATVNPNVVETQTQPVADVASQLQVVGSFDELRELVFAIVTSPIPMERYEGGARILEIAESKWYFRVTLRMLEVDELVRAQGLDIHGEWKLAGSKETRTRHVGNAVPPAMVAPVIEANMRSVVDEKRRTLQTLAAPVSAPATSLRRKSSKKAA